MRKIIFQRYYSVVGDKDIRFSIVIPKGWARAQGIKTKDKLLCEIFDDGSLRYSKVDSVISSTKDKEV